MKYLVTGGAGFIGSNLVKGLLNRNEDVRILDNFSTGRRQNIKDFESDVEVVEGDIRDFWVTLDACKGIDFVLHQAALPSVNRSVENPLTSNDVNSNGTLTVLECARRQGVKKLLFASSSSVYGDTPTLPKREDMIPCPLSPYAISKLTGEHYCRVYANLYGMSAIAMRYFNVFGPNQNPHSQYAAVIPKFITSIIADESPVFFGDGLQSRDFTYVDNVVHAVLTACQTESVTQGEFNLACGSQYTLRDLVDQLNSLIGKDIKPKMAPARPGDIKHSFADVSKLQKAFGIKPIVNFSDGLEKTIAFLKREALLTSRV
jgi:nucleoside-diphosphate-sugar epimerase